MQVLFVLAPAFLTCSACSSSGRRPDGSTELDAAGDLPPGLAADADQAIDTGYPQCFYEPVTLSPVGDATPCAFVHALPLAWRPNNCVVSFDVYLNGVLLPASSTHDGWGNGPTQASIVLFGGSCDTVISDPQNSVVQMTCICGFGPGP